ncbi:hypothetical protein [Mycolicibacterium komossense]|uniref:Uncharacterized protein n=1 Tax=Mycolicibacterium komossense TaxID=1779 RepID=A0ABT3CM49_9MYCO|nr:hypothetical protein [Mycolicibacterium komossense]MCV7230341.1 hypothetical protein [Mycolicibacterium komossense]
MIAIRVVLLLAGVASGLYGVSLLWENPLEVLIRIVIWAAAGVALHDFVFAPLSAAIGFAGRRVIPRSWWPPVAVAGLCSVVLVLLAIPVFSRPGAHADNLTVVDRNYPLGLWISLALVWACVPVYLVVTRFLPVRQDEMVQRQGAKHVDGQPPTV